MKVSTVNGVKEREVRGLESGKKTAKNSVKLRETLRLSWSQKICLSFVQSNSIWLQFRVKIFRRLNIKVSCSRHSTFSHLRTESWLCLPILYYTKGKSLSKRVSYFQKPPGPLLLLLSFLLMVLQTIQGRNLDVFLVIFSLTSWLTCGSWTWSLLRNPAKIINGAHAKLSSDMLTLRTLINDSL